MMNRAMNQYQSILSKAAFDGRNKMCHTCLNPSFYNAFLICGGFRIAIFQCNYPAS